MVSFTVKVVPVVIVVETISSVKVAVILVLSGALARLTGKVTVTLGRVVSPATWGTLPAPPPPRIVELAPSQHPSIKAVSSNAMNHISGLVIFLNLFIFFSSYLIQKNKKNIGA